MKTAVSISDNVYKKAERFAKKAKITRSKLYSTAIEEYLERQERKKIIEQINKVCEEVDTSVDPFWRTMQGRVLAKDEWK